MVSPINPVSIDALAGLRATAAERARSSPEDVQGPAGAGAGFGSAVTGALNDLAASQQRTAEAARAAATGDLQSVTEYMIAASESQLATQVTTAVRNRAIEAFNDIMRMQI